MRRHRAATSVLPALLERLGIAEGTLLRPDHALGILHFLATGERRAPEHALVLAKLLCGLPLEEPAGAPFDLTEDEAAEANALLNAVIGHWDALGGASPDALRGTFLTRPGKLAAGAKTIFCKSSRNPSISYSTACPGASAPSAYPGCGESLWVEWRM